MQNRESSAMGTPTPFSYGDSYRFRLKKCNARTKLTCPSCGKTHRFVPYYDTEGKITFPNYVGRCDREQKCGYHYPPKQYFNEHPEAKENCHDNDWTMPLSEPPQPKPKPPPSFIANATMRATLHAYKSNNFVTFLRSIMDDNAVAKVIERYHIGTVKKWDGGTVFWQVGEDGNVHAGKLMLYNPTDGHRVKTETRDKITWVHSVLRLRNFNLQQCYFGEHLLVDKSKTIALVESEKTAIIASVFFPNYIWIASGGKSGCFNSRMHILSGRNVILYPDLKATAEWQVKAEQMRRIGIKVEVSTYLESIATDEERSNGLDIADYIIKGIREKQYEAERPRREAEVLLAQMIEKHPSLQMLIERLQLEIIV